MANLSGELIPWKEEVKTWDWKLYGATENRELAGEKRGKMHKNSGATLKGHAFDLETMYIFFYFLFA